MKRFELRAIYMSEDIFEVEAETPEQAEELFMNSGGEYGDGHNVDYSLHEIASVKEAAE